MYTPIEELIQQLPSYFISEKAESLSAVIQIDLLQVPTDYWSVHIDQQECRVFHERSANPQIRLQAKPEDLLSILAGNLDITRAYMLGKIKFDGKLMLAMKIFDMFEIPESYRSIFD